MFRHDHAAMAGLVVLLLVLIAGIVGPYLYPGDPFDMVWAPFTRPGQEGYVLGTDYLGRDLLSLLIHGAQVSIAIGLSAAFLTVVIGITVGALAGFYKGWVEEGLDARNRVFPGVADTAVFDGNRGPVRRLATDDHLRHRCC